MRQFDSGATRDTDEGKLDYEGFLCHRVLQRYAEYMNKNRIQADGEVRGSDNWQKGIPQEAYMKSAFRHFTEWWSQHREGVEGGLQSVDAMHEAICALLFNAMGYLHEELKRDPKYGTVDHLKEPTLQEIISEVYEELATSRKERWDEGCTGGMGQMAPCMDSNQSEKI